MRKRNFLFSILVLSISLSVPQTLRAQCMPNSNITPSSYVPFTSIYYISAPDEAGDRLVVGSMSAANYSGLSGVPVQNVGGNQLFCNSITLAPGIVANAYVPTAAERTGNFSAFSAPTPLFFDPTCIGEGCPYYYPGGQIPISEIPTVFAWRIPAGQPGPPVYVSNFPGSQILRVDGSMGATSVLFTDPAADYLEGLAVGPDNLIYAADPTDNRIIRIDQSGESFATVYDLSTATPPAPTQPEGPSFGTLGLLTFNARNNDGVWQISFSSTDSPGTPVQIIPAGSGGGAVVGEATTFNLADEVLIVDDASNVVLQQTAPGASTTTTLIGSANLSWPFGVAVNSSGNIFVSNLNNANNCTTTCPTFTKGGYILQFTSGGTLVPPPYATFNEPDAPTFMQFDASGNLYVVTSQDWAADHGKVWRLPPPVPPATTSTPTLLVDLGYAYSNGTVPNLHWNSAVGVALPATPFTPPPLPIKPGIPVTYPYGNIINQTVLIPSESSLGGAASMAVNFQQWNPTVFDTTRLPATSTNTWSGGTPVAAGTTCTPIAGTGGNCIVIEDLCFASNGAPILPCEITAPSGALIGFTSKYQTQSPQQNPGLIIADDGGTDWANITTGYSADATISGGTKGLNTDTAIVSLGVGIASPPSLYFGTVYLGTITVKSVTVTNLGTAPMTINDPFIWIPSGGDSKEFVAVNLCPKSLAAGKSCTILVSFLAGPNYALQTAILSVVDSAPTSPQTVLLSATVINPEASLSSHSLDFGKEKVGSTSAKRVTLTNTGTTPLVLWTLTVSGDFALASGTTTCVNGGTLVPSASCAINVTFTPTKIGLRTGSVVITDNARFSPQIISLSGTGS